MRTKVSPFDRHPSSKLVEAFKGYQGREPGAARYLFMGLDANFSETIEDEPIFPEIIRYLSDGVAYWKGNKRHHPFLSPLYGKGGGYRYHLQFSKLGLTAEYADKISFIELLSCPTVGKTSEKRLMRLLDASHLRMLDTVLTSAIYSKALFIARGAYPRLYDIGRTFGCFTWLPKPQRFDMNKLYKMEIQDNLRVHVITHFSDAISSSHLAEIRAAIETEHT